MKIIQCKQGTKDWFDARCGRITASEMADMLQKNVQGPLKDITSAKRESLKAFLAGEIMTGQPDQMGYVSAYMERGTELEPEARSAYEDKNNVMVQEIGFIVHPTIDRSGASPDGLIGKDGGLEIKVPGIAKHINYLDTEILPKEYEPQVMWNLACSGREWWDFVSYCPVMPRGKRIFQIRVYPKVERIAEIEAALMVFLADTDRLVASLNERYPEPVAQAASVDADADLMLNEEFDDECFAGGAQ